MDGYVYSRKVRDIFSKNVCRLHYTCVTAHGLVAFSKSHVYYLQEDAWFFSSRPRPTAFHLRPQHVELAGRKYGNRLLYRYCVRGRFCHVTFRPPTHVVAYIGKRGIVFYG